MSTNILDHGAVVPTDDNPRPLLQNNATVLPPPPTTTIVTYHSDFNTIAVAVLSGLLVFLSVLVIVIVTKILKDRFSDRRAQPWRQTAEQSKETEERIIRRYETIEHWLITKKVEHHDEFCARVVSGIIPQSPSDEEAPSCQGCSSGQSPETMTNCSSDDSLFADDDDKECPICMNSLNAGNIVSWSANTQCSHVVCSRLGD